MVEAGTSVVIEYCAKCTGPLGSTHVHIDGALFHPHCTPATHVQGVYGRPAPAPLPSDAETLATKLEKRRADIRSLNEGIGSATAEMNAALFEEAATLIRYQASTIAAEERLAQEWEERATYEAAGAPRLWSERALKAEAALERMREEVARFDVMTADTLRLHMGELSAQELRAVKSFRNWFVTAIRARSHTEGE